MPDMGPRGVFVYIVASLGRRLYTGVTGDLIRRLRAHHAGVFPGQNRDCRITRLVYYERVSPPTAAITRQEELKRWPRTKRVALIETNNPGWLDLAANWFTPAGRHDSGRPARRDEGRRKVR